MLYNYKSRINNQFIQINTIIFNNLNTVFNKTVYSKQCLYEIQYIVELFHMKHKAV